MAEPLIENGETVVKSENENKATTEHKETENGTQTYELSKSENDSADSESTLKNTDVEHSVSGNNWKKNGAKEKLVSEVRFILIPLNWYRKCLVFHEFSVNSQTH
jgi:hypothetical protein